jgi:hypothetical protein
MAIVAALATNSRNRSSRFDSSSAFCKLMPVRLPPGRLKLLTNSSSTGSRPVRKTMGISDVTALAASAELTPPMDRDDGDAAANRS